MKPEAFLDILEQRQLAPASIIAQLRRKLQDGDARVTAESVLKFLVKKELVTRVQAQELMDSILGVSQRAESSILGPERSPDPSAEATQISRQAPPRAPTTPAKPRPVASLNDDLQMAPDPDEEDSPPLSAAKPASRGAQPGSPVAASSTAAAAARLAGDAAGDAAARLGPDAFDAQDALAADDAGADAKLLAGSGKRGGKRRRRSKPAKGRSEWDSPLLLLGGGGLVLLLGAGALIYYLLFRENADAVLKEASDAFDNGSYTQAIQSYEHFVASFPRHAEISSAKVRLGMTRLWKATEGTGNFPAALQTAEQVIAEIEDEAAFAEDEAEGDGVSKAKRELSSLLTQIAKGLSGAAEAAAEPSAAAERAAETQRALALCNNTKYVPQRFRLDSDLETVRETLARVDARRQREDDLAAALTAMEGAVGQGDAAAAYAAHDKLLDKHPQLRENEALREKVLAAAQAERAGVAFVAESLAATNQPRPSAVAAAVACSRTVGESAPGVAGAVVVQADGALYGVKASSGEVLWRRYVGRQGGGHPALLGEEAVVAVDSRYGDLLNLELTSGKLRWRLPLAQTLGPPQIVGKQVFVATDKARLYRIDAETGATAGYVQFSQPLSAAVAPSADGSRLYAAGERSNVYALATDTLDCLGVYYLGHGPQAVAASPVQLLDKLVVAENAGAQTGRLHVLALDAQGVPDREVAAARIEGLASPPLLALGRRLVVLSTRGAVSVYEIGAGDDQSALTPLAARDPVDAAPLAQHGLLALEENQTSLWVAGGDLQRLGILPTGNRLPVRSLDRDYQGDAFDFPLQRAGNLIVHLRRPHGAAGARVAAMDATANRALWETELAVPAAGAAAIDAANQRVTLASASGAVYPIDRQGLVARVFGKAAGADLPPGSPPLNACVDLGGGSLAAGSSGGEALVLYQASQPERGGRVARLDSPLAAPLTAWRGGVVAALEAGQVAYLDPVSAVPLATPFQPPLTPGSAYRWLVGTGDPGDPRAALVVSDGVEKIYALHLQADPQPHLSPVAAGAVGGAALTTPLAIVGDHVLAGDAEGGVASYDLADLSRAGRVDLGSPIVWGPFAGSESALAGLANGEFVLLGARGEILWRRPSPRGNPVGRPLWVDEGVVAVLDRGSVVRLSLADGSEAGAVDVDEPAADGPLVFGRRAAVVAADGTLLFVDLP